MADTVEYEEFEAAQDGGSAPGRLDPIGARRRA